MAGIEQTVLMNMCMICDGDRVLILDKKDDDFCGITFPGGHVELGEPFTDAVIREVLEETGLHIAAPKLCGIKDWCKDGVRYIVLLYRADRFSGKLIASEEGAVYWCTLQEMRQSDLASGMAGLLEVFLDENLSEFFYEQNNGMWHEVLK